MAAPTLMAGHSNGGTRSECGDDARDGVRGDGRHVAQRYQYIAIQRHLLGAAGQAVAHAGSGLIADRHARAGLREHGGKVLVAGAHHGDDFGYGRAQGVHGVQYQRPAVQRRQQLVATEARAGARGQQDAYRHAALTALRLA